MDEDDYGFQEEDQTEANGPEDEYYKGKDEKNEVKKLKHFEEVLKLEGKKKGEWGFRALKRIVKYYFAKRDYANMMKRYREMLTYIKTAVTRNKSEKAINSILDLVSACEIMPMLQDFYEATLAALRESKNERLWFKTNLKLANLYFQREDYARMTRITRELKGSCLKSDGTEDLNKGSQLLEIYALEIQMYTQQKNNKKLKEIYESSLRVKNALIHPRFMGIIRECGGKMHSHEGRFRDAYTDFMEAFKSYDEAGSPHRITCLKYVIVANMLAQSNINPMEAPETKAFKDDKEVLALSHLIVAYQTQDITGFEAIINDPQKKQSILGDPFIRQYIEDLLRNIRCSKLKNILRPYTTIRLDYISKAISTPINEVEQLLVSMILDGQIVGRIDQLQGILILEDKSVGVKKYAAMSSWINEISSMNSFLAAKTT